MTWTCEGYRYARPLTMSTMSGTSDMKTPGVILSLVSHSSHSACPMANPSIPVRNPAGISAHSHGTGLARQSYTLCQTARLNGDAFVARLGGQLHLVEPTEDADRHDVTGVEIAPQPDAPVVLLAQLARAHPPRRREQMPQALTLL